MDLPALREPVSCLTHAAGLAAGVPVALVLLSHAGRDHARRAVAVVFCFGMALCYGASALFHGWSGDSETLRWLHELDHVGVHFLIAGTYTPIAWVYLRGKARWIALGLAWGFALGGAGFILVRGVLPIGLFTPLYLAMGWGGVGLYVVARRQTSPWFTRTMFRGGIWYSLGALVNWARWPDPVPGWLGAHEIFHLFVLAGTAAHARFIAATLIASSAAPPAWAIPPHHLAAFSLGVRRLTAPGSPPARRALRRAPPR